MSGEKNLAILIKEMKPYVNEGQYVFVSVKDSSIVSNKDIIGLFRETEGVTLILDRSIADKRNLSYTFIASWITLKVHSALDAVGLTAAFSTELAAHNISCNVMAGFYHDHIFVAKEDEAKTIKVLTNLSERQ